MNYFDSRTPRDRRKVDKRLSFEEWQARRTVCASNYSLVTGVQYDAQDIVQSDSSTLLFTEPTSADILPGGGVDVMDGLPSVPVLFEPDSLEARLVYAVFDILHQQVLYRKR